MAARIVQLLGGVVAQCLPDKAVSKQMSLLAWVK